jgi:hypothetical protein
VLIFNYHFYHTPSLTLSLNYKRRSTPPLSNTHSIVLLCYPPKVSGSSLSVAVLLFALFLLKCSGVDCCGPLSICCWSVCACCGPCPFAVGVWVLCCGPCLLLLECGCWCGLFLLECGRCGAAPFLLLLV